jgi:hypothetical protein
MTFEEFIQKVAPKVGARSAFDLARDARIQALEKLVTDIIKDQKKVDETFNAELQQLADGILKMPPVPDN